MNRGFTAITSLLVIASIIGLISFAIPLINISGLQQVQSNQSSQQDLYLAEACLEDSLLALTQGQDLPSSIVLPETECQLVLNDQVGSLYTFTIKADQNNHPKYIQAIYNSATASLDWNQAIDLGSTPTSGPSPTPTTTPLVTPSLTPTTAPTSTPFSTPTSTSSPTPTPPIQNCYQYCQTNYQLPGSCLKSKDCQGIDVGKIYECGGSKTCCCQ